MNYDRIYTILTALQRKSTQKEASEVNSLESVARDLVSFNNDHIEYLVARQYKWSIGKTHFYFMDTNCLVASDACADKL